MVFADASALVAILAEEPDGAALTDRLEAEGKRLCSALSVWETVAALCHRYSLSVASAREDVGRYLEAGDFQFVAIGEQEFEIAADAYAQFGKGRHPAALNMGDCFSYACAKANRAALLFKGDDFSRTDIEAA
ncbi:MAG TPA: type II toxin-antitoxin system VapC family toxin [Acetobacteraceae bacterium]